MAPRSLGLTFVKTEERIARVEKHALALVVILLAVNTIANVIGRYLLGNSLYFSDEVNQLLVVVLTFVGMSLAAREGRHIRMTAIVDILDLRWQKRIWAAVCLTTSLTMFGICVITAQYIDLIIDLGRVSPALRIPMQYVYTWVSISFAMTGFSYFYLAIYNAGSATIAQAIRPNVPETPH